jgi:predicted esterase
MPRLSLVCLHGFTQNGAQLRVQLGPVASGFPAGVELLYPDAPHACAPESVAGMVAAFRMPQPPPAPHLCWWNATDDGKEYRGWEKTRAQLRELCERRDGSARVGVLGFSQGAIAAAALAGLHEHGDFPALDFVVLIAGRLPRSELLAPLFRAPVRLPSLHIWGERDVGAVQASPALVEAFSVETRQVATWQGPHAVPERGPAADALVQWVTRFA